MVYPQSRKPSLGLVNLYGYVEHDAILLYPKLTDSLQMRTNSKPVNNPEPQDFEKLFDAINRVWSLAGGFIGFMVYRLKVRRVQGLGV